MFPEDRVLVGVVKRKRDWKTVREARWYHIPQAQHPEGIHVEYLAFFCSRAAIGKESGIYYYARCRGVELLKRRDLFPSEINHPRAEVVYYRVQLDQLQATRTPILNQPVRRFAFVRTTWDRFVKAQTIEDLYAKDECFVDRIYFALRDKGLRVERSWMTSYHENAPVIKVICESGEILASDFCFENLFYLDQNTPEDELFAQLKAEMAKKGGPVYLTVPTENYY